jgi:NitT/TauT family transport system substrate-binding protein
MVRRWHGLWWSGGVCALLVVLAACGPGAAPSKPAGSAPAGTGAASAPAAPSTSGGAGAAPATGATSAPAPAAVQPLNPPVRVAVGLIGIFVDIGILIAQERGYFQEEGLDVAIEMFRNGAEQIPPLASNQIQFGTMAIDPSLYNAVARDIPLKIVSEKSRNSPQHGVGAIVARADLYESGALNDVSKLRGKTIAVPSNGIPIRYSELALAKGGLTLDDVEMTTIPFPDMPAALANKSIEAAWMNEPYLVLSEERGFARRLASAADLYPRLISNILVISARFAQENPEAARRFVTAYLRGQRDYFRGFQLRQDEALRQQIVDIAVKETPVKDAALYDRMGFHAVEPNGYIDASVVAELQDWFASRGQIPEPVDVSRIIDRQYLDYALQRLGTLPDPYR